MKGLTFFKRTSDRRTWNLISWHSPHSLTWSWIFSFSLFKADEGRVWPLFSSYRTNNGFQWMLRIPLVGFVSWCRQHPTWFRDMYLRERDEKDFKAYQRSTERTQPKPTVTDYPNTLN